MALRSYGVILSSLLLSTLIAEGTRREAQAELARLLAQVADGEHVRRCALALLAASATGPPAKWGIIARGKHCGI
jgi:hypothetical protein